ncbi:MAG TPA: hypothetical protein VF658_14390 [Pyrinomonadaceae bacterium]
MKNNDNVKAGHVSERLWQIAVGILALSIIPLGVGLRFRVASHIRIGAFFMGISLFLMLIATAIWAVRWIKENVRID